MRLQSDSELARDSRTACLWQANVNNQQHMMSSFAAAMAKLAVLGQDANKMVDCSDVLPRVKPFTKAATFPAGLSHADVQQACATSAFPTLRTDPGPVTSVAPVYVLRSSVYNADANISQQPSFVNPSHLPSFCLHLVLLLVFHGVSECYYRFLYTLTPLYRFNLLLCFNTDRSTKHHVENAQPGSR